MELEEAIRTRRTHKAYGSEPVDHGTLGALLELARWAPNHNLTNPWRFRVLGPRALAALKEAGGSEAAGKLDRAPTLVAVSYMRSEDPVQDEEDLCATACAAHIVLLGAHARGLARRSASTQASGRSGCSTSATPGKSARRRRGLRLRVMCTGWPETV